MKSQGQLLRNARELRKHGTDAELLLWRSLRDCQLAGVKFKRQQPIERYIVDFVAFASKLIIEVDGSQHMESRCNDEERDACLRRNGFIVLRFWNNEVFENLTGVLEVIRFHCVDEIAHASIMAPSPSPRPSPARGEGEF